MRERRVVQKAVGSERGRGGSHSNTLAALFGVSALCLAGCGGGGDSGGAPPPPPPPATTNVSVTVVDGALGNALVCLDKNGNGACDADETQGRTAANGKVTFTIATADVGKYPVVAVVGTDAVDAQFGAVAVKYTLTTPADHTAVVSPLTTLVQQTMARTGASSADAASAIQATTGIAASLFADYTAAGSTSGAISPAAVARMWVLLTQAQTTAVAAAVGTQTIDGATITQSDADAAVAARVLDLLPDMVTTLADPAVAGAADMDAAMASAATALVNTSGLNVAAMATAVAVNTQIASGNVPIVPPAASINLQSLSFTDAQNYSFRTLGASAAQATPDANQNARYVDRRTRAVAGIVTRWGSGVDPWRNADLNWNGSAWVHCPINYENLTSVRDAHGRNRYGYCDARETGTTQRASLDISGRSMADFYAQMRTAGYTNLFIADPAVLGSATFPSGSSVFLHTTMPMTEAITYYPSGPDNPAGTGNVTTQYSAEVAAGGIAANQPAGTGCNAPEANTSGTVSTTLESLIASKRGTPCVFGQGSITYNGNTYLSDPSNEWAGNSTVSLGKLGTVPVTPTVASSGYYTGNTLLRAAFVGTGANAATYYACKERYVNGSPRNCTTIGTGTYSITQLGDARVLTFNNLPLATTSLTFTRVFVERGGFIYIGFQSKPLADSQARLNLTATGALLTQLGITPDDPAVPLALTASSYQGSWDLRGTSEPVSATVGVLATITPTGAVSCIDKETNTGFACTLTITDVATGAFTFSDGTGSTAQGNFDYLNGKASGTFHDPTSTPPDGPFTGGRR